MRTPPASSAANDPSACASAEAGSKDAALVLQLTPGSYTVQISGVANSAGTVLVEIYDADL